MSNATHLRGIKIPKAVPANNQVLAYNSATKELYWTSSGGGGGSASWGGITGTLSAQTDLSSALAGKADTTHNQAASTITDFSEAVDDRVASLLVAGSNVTLSYNDVANTLTISSSGGGGGAAWGSITGTLSSQSDLNTALGLKADASALSSYATTSALTSGLAGKADVSHTQAASTITDFAEAVDDRVAVLLQQGSNISLTYNDVSNTLTIATTGLTNYTDEQAQDAVGAILTDSTSIDFTYNDGSNTITASAIFGTTAGTVAEGNHTQAASTITDFSEAVDDRVSSLLVAGEAITLAYNDPSNTLTVASPDPVQTLGSVSGSTAITMTNSGATATIAGNTTFTFSGSITSANVKGFLLQLTNGGAFAITWPASVKWPGGVAPVLTPSGVDFIMLVTIDGGTNWRGTLQGRDSR